MWKITSDGTSRNTIITFNGVVVSGVQALSIGASADIPVVHVSLAIANVELDITAEDDMVAVTPLDIGFEADDTPLTQEGAITEEMLAELMVKLSKGPEDEEVPSE